MADIARRIGPPVVGRVVEQTLLGVGLLLNRVYMGRLTIKRDKNHYLDKVAVFPFCVKLLNCLKRHRVSQ